MTLRFEVQDDGNPTKPTLLSVDNVVVNNRVDDYQDYITYNPQVLVDALSNMDFVQHSNFSATDYQTFWNAAASLEATKKLPAIPAAEKTAAQNCIQSTGNPFAQPWWWGIPPAVMADVSAIYQTWQSSLRTAAGCP